MPFIWARLRLRTRGKPSSAAGYYPCLRCVPWPSSLFFVIFRPDYEPFGNGHDERVLSTGFASVALPQEVRPDVARSVTIPTLGYIGPTKGEAAFANSARSFVPSVRGAGRRGRQTGPHSRALVVTS
jgi:hypothetical protein